MKKIIAVVIGGAFVAVASVISLAPQEAAAALPISHIITVKDVNANPVVGATVSISCPGGVYSALPSVTDSNGATVWLVRYQTPVASDCAKGEGMDILVANTGYVTTELATTTSGYTFFNGTYNFYVNDVPLE